MFIILFIITALVVSWKVTAKAAHPRLSLISWGMLVAAAIISFKYAFMYLVIMVAAATIRRYVPQVQKENNIMRFTVASKYGETVIDTGKAATKARYTMSKMLEAAGKAVAKAGNTLQPAEEKLEVLRKEDRDNTLAYLEELEQKMQAIKAELQ